MRDKKTFKILLHITLKLILCIKDFDGFYYLFILIRKTSKLAQQTQKDLLWAALNILNKNRSDQYKDLEPKIKRFIKYIFMGTPIENIDQNGTPKAALLVIQFTFKELFIEKRFILNS